MPRAYRNSFRRCLLLQAHGIFSLSRRHLQGALRESWRSQLIGAGAFDGMALFRFLRFPALRALESPLLLIFLANTASCFEFTGAHILLSHFLGVLVAVAENTGGDVLRRFLREVGIRLESAAASLGVLPDVGVAAGGRDVQLAGVDGILCLVVWVVPCLGALSSLLVAAVLALLQHFGSRALSMTLRHALEGKLAILGHAHAQASRHVTVAREYGSLAAI